MAKGKVITLTGAPAERGFAQGQMLREEIFRGWETLKNYGPFRGAKPWFLPMSVFMRAAAVWAKKQLALTFETFPHFAEFFRGIAEGARIPEWKLALIHFVEIAGSDAARQLMGCSSVAVVPPRSDEPILAKNFDFINDFLDFDILRKNLKLSGFASVEFTMAPIAGSHTGFNESGVALTYNYGYSRERPRKGTLFTARVQEVLDVADSVERAVRIIRRKPNPEHGIITIVDREGNAAAVELSPLGTAVVEPTDGVIYNANLYHHPSMRERLIPLDAVYGPRAPKYLRGVKIQETNVIRTERLRYLLSQHKKIDVEVLKKIMGDHGENGIPSENTICRHHESFSTHLSAIILPKSRKMYYKWGTVCSPGEWEEISL